jgi:hypothetical protein
MVKKKIFNPVKKVVNEKEVILIRWKNLSKKEVKQFKAHLTEYIQLYQEEETREAEE